MDVHGYIYSSVFNPFAPLTNLLVNDDNGCGDGQFWLQSVLHTNMTYILVVSTDTPSVPGTVSIVSKGVSHVTFSRLGEFRSRDSQNTRTYHMVLRRRNIRTLTFLSSRNTTAGALDIRITTQYE